MLDDSSPPPLSSFGPRRLKEMTSARVAATLAHDPRVIVPVGTCAQFHPALPLGCATMIVERLADDLSAEFALMRTPTVEYGVNPPVPEARDAEEHEALAHTLERIAGGVCLRKKTLHRTLNDLLASWETYGASEFVVLTAHGYDPHLEALSTVTTVSARVRTVDVFGVNLSDLPVRRTTDDRATVYLALLLYLAPQFVDTMAIPPDWDVRNGAEIYEHLRARISERIFLAPVPDA